MTSRLTVLDLRRALSPANIPLGKARGVYKGRRRSIASDQVRQIKVDGIGATVIARRLGIGRATACKVLREVA